MKTIEFNEFADEAGVSHSRKIHPYDVVVGRNLRHMRARLGISQEDLAARMGYSFQQLQKQEKAVNRISASTLIRLAGHLGCDPSELLRGAGDGQEPMPNQLEEFSTSEMRLITNFRALKSSSDRFAIAQMIKTMATNNAG
jgi:transcriptional regulator with XRE-family HTH domain